MSNTVIETKIVKNIGNIVKAYVFKDFKQVEVKYLLPTGTPFHRADGPAVEEADGSKVWYVNGKIHRDDGPAKEWANGDKWWWVNGKLHREDGPAKEWANGSREWYVNGELHREDGPAIEYEDWIS